MLARLRCTVENYFRDEFSGKNGKFNVVVYQVRVKGEKKFHYEDITIFGQNEEMPPDVPELVEAAKKNYEVDIYADITPRKKVDGKGNVDVSLSYRIMSVTVFRKGADEPSAATPVGAAK